MDNESPIHTLDEQECWEFLTARQFGRLAFAISDDVYIIPINYVADRDQSRLVFRTGEGTKLFGVTVSGSVALEVDTVHSNSARSVVVRGKARVLEGHDAEKAEQLPLRPWVPTLKYNVVSIAVEELSGREFDLGEEPVRY